MDAKSLATGVQTSTMTAGTSDGRRRLMRAGLAAAPVLMALKSRSVLAADICIKASAFASLQANTTVSHAVETFTCFSHGYWKNQPFPAPYGNKATSYFLGVPRGASGSVSAGFSGNPGGTFSGKTLQQILELSGGSFNELARNTVATFLTAVQYGDNPQTVLLTQAQCRTLWMSLAGGGTWSPFTGANWDLTETLAYFKYIYG
ncbi:conserved hypothetical protein [Candidatus Accumulibacter aalborgensis]|uniref:Uncharacterized protein n=1 Tax=Candidatus Accumulibacter aalborgensis TaxID=1860102 RepID=A0A1A8XJ69_9PROT|nr:hypothetical protein [Candidatus Accumulibacter aalborgensis]SBT05234.1 conserved hypothetical protein [Candidatus Accumulibacter aalborgensis]